MTYVSAVSCVLGEECELTELSGLQHLTRALQSEGILGFRRMYQEPWEPTVEAALSSLDLAGPALPEAVIFASSTLNLTEPDPDQSALVQCLVRLPQLRHLPVFGFSTGDCTNTGLALAGANSLVQSGVYASVLLLTTDRWSDKNRLLADETAILSDGVAACIVARRPPAAGGLVLLGIVNATDYTIFSGGRSVPAMERLHTQVDNIRVVVASALDASQCSTRDVTYLACNHLRPGARRFLKYAAHLPYAPLVDSGILCWGHFSSSDILFDLGWLEASRTLTADDRVLALFTGPTGSTAALLGVSPQAS